MRFTRIPLRSVLVSLCLLAALLLAACAVSGGNGSDANQSASTPTTTTNAQITPTAGGDNGGNGGNGGGGNPTPVPLSQFNAYAGSEDGIFYGFNADSGGQRWHYTIAGTPNKPYAVTNAVYVSTQGGYVYSFSKTGSLNWSKSVGGTILGRPTMDSGLVYVGNDQGRVFALNSSTGDISWSYTTGGMISGAVSVANNVAYASADGKLFALNSLNGQIVWTASIGAISEFTSPTIS